MTATIKRSKKKSFKNNTNRKFVGKSKIVKKRRSIGTRKNKQLPRPKVCEHQKDEDKCWALDSDFRPCKRKRALFVKTSDGRKVSNVVPYCSHHLKYGDSAIKVIDHPTNSNVGKILIAQCPLPVKYRIIYWGDRIANSSAAEERDDR